MMHKLLGSVSLGLFFLVAFVATAFAQETQQEQPPPTAAQVAITSPSANSTVSSIFTLTGTATPVCRLSNNVFASDNQVSGTIESIPQRSGNRFTYTVNTAKVLTRDGLDPYTLKAGKIELTVYADDPGCDYDYESVILTLQYPAAPPPPQAQKKQVEVPAKVEQAVASPSPSPTPLVINEAPAVKDSFFDKLDSPWWLVLGALLGAALLGLAQYTAHRYHLNHPKKKK